MFVGSPGPTHWFIKISPGIWKQVCWFLLQVEEMYMVSKEVNNMRPYLLCLICLCYHVTCVTTSEFFKTAAILALAAHWENWKRLTFNNNFSPKSPPSTAFNKVYFIMFYRISTLKGFYLISMLSAFAEYAKNRAYT